MNSVRTTAVFALLLLLSGPAMAAGNAAPASPVLQWKSRNEVGVYGYIVYRSDRHSGPFLRVNARIIPRQPTPAEGVENQYRFVDESASPERAYFYYIDAIGDSGRRQRLTPIVQRNPPAPSAGVH